jgi:hypothetical protein
MLPGETIGRRFASAPVRCCCRPLRSARPFIRCWLPQMQARRGLPAPPPRPRWSGPNCCATRRAPSAGTRNLRPRQLRGLRTRTSRRPSAAFQRPGLPRPKLRAPCCRARSCRPAKHCRKCRRWPLRHLLLTRHLLQPHRLPPKDLRRRLRRANMPEARLRLPAGAPSGTNMHLRLKIGSSSSASSRAIRAADADRGGLPILRDDPNGREHFRLRLRSVYSRGLDERRPAQGPRSSEARPQPAPQPEPPMSLSPGPDPVDQSGANGAAYGASPAGSISRGVSCPIGWLSAQLW